MCENDSGRGKEDAYEETRVLDQRKKMVYLRDQILILMQDNASAFISGIPDGGAGAPPATF